MAAEIRFAYRERCAAAFGSLMSERPLDAQLRGSVGGGMPLKLYRVVQSDPPSLIDFTSQKAKGIPMARPDPEVALLWDGISVYATESQARNRATTLPHLGAYIAELVIVEGDPITIRRTGTGRGHHTLWGDPAELLARVSRVVNV